MVWAVWGITECWSYMFELTWSSLFTFKFRNWGSDKAEDSLQVSPQGTGGSGSSYSKSCGLSLDNKAAIPGGLKLLQEIQEWTCTAGFVQSVYIERIACCDLYVCHVWNLCLLSWNSREPLSKVMVYFSSTIVWWCTLCSRQKYNSLSILKMHVIIFFCSFET